MGDAYEKNRSRFGKAQIFSWLAGLFPASKDIHHAAEAFIEQLDREEIDQFRVMTDF
jgi:hypothetical protein